MARSTPATSVATRAIPFALFLLCALAALVRHAAALPLVSVREDRFIPDTQRNRQYFKNVTAIINEGTRTDGSAACGSRDAVISCIATCNSPGDRKRGNCCCITDNQGSRFLVGVAGQCRYRQVLLIANNANPPSMTYKSSPIGTGEPPIFDPDTCSPTNVNTNGNTCACELSWTLTQQEIINFVPSPSPSASLLPPSANPSVSMAASVSPAPSASASASMAPSPPASAAPSTVPAPPTGASVSPAASTEVVGRPIPGPIGPSNTAAPSTAPDSGVDAGTGAGIGAGAGSEAGSGIQSPEPESSDELSAPSPDEVAGEGNGGASPSPVSGTTQPASSPTEEDDICVDAAWLAARGAQAEDFVHSQHIDAEVLCPAVEGLPCGTKHHAVRVADGRLVGYGELCAMGPAKCSTQRMKVNSVWSHQWSESSHGDVKLTMLDVRHPEFAQNVLHRVMRSLRTARIL